MSRREGVLGDEQRAAEAAKADAVWTRQMTYDLKTILGMKEGRRFLGRLIFNECGVFGSQWTPSAEVHVVAGKRMIGDSILARAELADPGATRLMVDEWFNDRNEWRTAQDRAAKKPRRDDDAT